MFRRLSKYIFSCVIPAIITGVVQSYLSGNMEPQGLNWWLPVTVGLIGLGTAVTWDALQAKSKDKDLEKLKVSMIDSIGNAFEIFIFIVAFFGAMAIAMFFFSMLQ